MKKTLFLAIALLASAIANAQTATGNLNGHEYVDLGLPSGIKWATTNVGANIPEEWGNHYAWGELSGKDNYCKEYYEGYRFTRDYDEVTGGGKDADGFEIPLKKVHHEYTATWPDYGTNITAGPRDVASAVWGQGWRIPTQKETQELIKKCKWEWTTKNDVRGYKVTGPNGNWIFLPAAGYRSGLALNRAETRGYYWTSEMSKKSAIMKDYYYNKPYYLYLGQNKHKVYVFDRTSGLSVRAVCK